MSTAPLETSLPKPLRVALALVAAVVLGPLVVTVAGEAAAPELVRLGILVPGEVPSLVRALAVVALVLLGGLALARVRRAGIEADAVRQALDRLGDGDGAARVDLSRMPELVGLGVAFNSATRRLARQRAEIEARADIDRTMLLNADVDRVATTIVARIPSLADCDVVALAVLAPGAGRPSGHLFYAVAGEESPPAVKRADMGMSEIVETKAIPGESVIGPGQRTPVLAARLVETGAQGIAAFPIDWNGGRIGLLLLGFRRPEHLDAEDRARLRRLAERAGEALAGASREEQLFANAHFDPLTGLPTRLLLNDRLEREVSRAHRERRELALLVCDLDRFRDVSWLHGEAAAEQALKQVASRLAACVRDSDTAARTRGDAFAVLLSDIASPLDAGTVAESIVRVVAQPLQIAGRDVFMTASVGVAVYPHDGADAEDLFKHADMAMCRAKAAGRNRHVFFEERMNQEATERARAQGELRLAIERGEMVLHFQPQVDLASGEVVGAEALLRWRHPERGIVLPREFIPVAEQTGLITRIGYWVLDEVGRVIDAWREQGVEAPRVVVNVSLRQFRDPAFPDAVRFTMKRWGLARGSIGFEITESSLLDDPETVVRVLSQLKSLGALVSIEDFGIRRSALSLLSRLPYDLIKIDRVFVRDLARDTESASLVRAIIAIAHQFGKQVIAEGIEADTQREFLRHHGCDLAQGILLGRPLPAPEFLSYLVSQRLLRTSAERAKKLVER
jgi:diguanylate cyclase (GGDEF)-like protein